MSQTLRSAQEVATQEPKAIPRYGKIAYALKYAAYCAHLSAVTVPVVGLSVLSIMGILIAVMVALVTGVAGIVLLLSSHSWEMCFWCFLACLVSLLIVGGCGYLFRLAFTEAPPGHFLNPQPPQMEIYLRDSELLVRASQPNS